MNEIQDEAKLIPLEEIKKFKIDINEINNLNNKLDEDFIIDTILYHDVLKKEIKFKGTLINNVYEGRGILYENNSTLNGYFKNGKLEGFGRYDKENGKKFIIGYFKNGECIKGIIKYKNYIKYEYEFKPEQNSYIGIEYSSDGNIQRKMEYDFQFGFPIPKDYSFGILYDNFNNIIYSGLLKNLKPRESKNLAIYNKYGIKMYFGNISNFLYNGKGIVYYNNSDEIYFKGIFNYGNYNEGILFDPKENKIYEGKFMNNFPSDSKNIKLFNLDKKLIYVGDIKDGLYDNYGKIYNKNGNLIYEGELLKGKYNKHGKIYKNNGYSIVYEGEFLNGLYHGYGKLIGEYEGYFSNGFYEGEGIKYEKNRYIKAIFQKGKINDINARIYKYSCLETYLYFEGNIKNNTFDGFGKIYYQNKNLLFQGNFENGNVCGKGVKYYETGAKKIEGIFDSLNKCQGFYYNPDGIKIYEGEIINDIPFNVDNIIIYDDNTNKIFEGNIKNGKYEGPGKEYFNLINDKILYEGTFKNNYFIEQNLDYYETKRIKILVTSYQRGYHSCEFVEKLITGKVGSFSGYTEGEKIYNFEYNCRQFSSEMNFFDDLYKLKARYNFFNKGKNIKIFIFVVDISLDEKSIDEPYIYDSLKSINPGTIIYLIVKGIDQCEDKGKFLNFRNQARTLIIKNIITKYFELSLSTGEGFENLKKNLIIDSALKSRLKLEKSFFKNEKLLKYINF